MATKEFVDGPLRVTYPDAFEARTVVPTRPRPRTRFAAETSTAASNALLIEALQAQELKLVNPVEVAPARRANRRGSAASSSGTLTMELEVAPDEDAVVLLEHDDVLSWELPTKRTQAAAAAQPRRGQAQRRVIRFQIPLAATPAAAPQRRRGKRSLAGTIVGGVRAYVFKFVAKAVVGKAMAFLERHVPRGLVVFESPDPKTWRPVENLADIEGLPRDRPTRILLFIHGTFSSTTGSFGALAAHDEGRTFLQSALSTYDAVIGYDHPTLSRDPLENAVDLLARLEKATLPMPPTIDIVCYSRGGLVARSLIEHLLPSSTWKANTDRVVFVGATNAGTTFAEPDNWHALIDLYTNLAAAATRAVGVISGASLAAEIARGVVESVGAFVKYVVSYAVDGGGVPGLAAMEPDGDFVKRLNKTQRGQPGPGTPWFVVSSDFQPKLVGEGQLKELPARLVGLLADGFVDGLIKSANDLVVDTSSMSAIDLPTVGFVQDSLAFGANGRVYHLAYFIQPEVGRALRDWLTSSSRRNVVPRGSTVSIDLPRAARRDVVVLNVEDPASEARKRISTRQPKWVVLNSDDKPSQHYSIETEAISAWIRSHQRAPNMRGTLRLDTLHKPATFELNDALRDELRAAVRRQSRGTVLIDGGTPTAVIDHRLDPASLDELAKSARRSRRRASADAAPRREDPAAAAAPDAAPVDLMAHLDAQMPGRLQLNEVCSVTCRLSREALPLPDGGKAGSFPVKDRPIVIQIVPKVNAEVIGDDRVSLPLPPAGEPAAIIFDFKPTHTGICAVSVVARQGPMPLVSLDLKASVEEKLSQSSRPPTTANATVSTTPVEGVDGLPWLEITETRNGDDTIYRYELKSGRLGLLETDESKPIPDPAAYLQGLYEELEKDSPADRDDMVAFQELVQDFGSALFTELFPRSFQQQLWKHRNKLGNLVVLSDEPHIPWELVHLKDPDKPRPRQPHFLGQYGLVRWIYGAQDGFFRPTLRARPGRVWSLCPQYSEDEGYFLPETAAEAQFLEDKFDARPVEPTDRAVRDLLRDGGFDLLHFAGHGEAEQDNIERAQIMIGDGTVDGEYVPRFLRAMTVAQNADLDSDGDGGPLVVLNACQAGRGGLQLTSLGGFAHAFLSRGAAAFISTLWSVGDAPARTFIEAFYDELLEKQPMATAVKNAREKARKGGDATWISYVVYAHPGAVLTRTGH